MRLSLLPTLVAANALLLGVTALLGFDLVQRYDRQFYVAQAAQAQLLADAAATDVLWGQQVRLATAVVQEIAADRGLVAAVAARDAAAVAARLADQQGRGAVTSGDLHPLGAAAYGPTMAPIGEAWFTPGGGPLRDSPAASLAAAAARTGVARLRLLQIPWASNGAPRLTLLAPVGGLRPAGYVALHLDAVRPLAGLDRRLNMHVAVLALESDRTLLELPDVPAPQGRAFETIVTVHTPSGEPFARLRLQEDVSKLSAVLARIRQQALVRFALVAGGICAASIVAVWLYDRRTRRREAAEAVAEARRRHERQVDEAHIRHLAHHDLLTGLANRVLFHDEIERALTLAAGTGGTVALLCLDLDRFKAVNDLLGHQAGDTLLQHVAARLGAAIRAGDVLARVGGDEFVVLQTQVGQPDAAHALAQRLVEVLSAPFDIDGQQACIGASVGVALFPRDGAAAEDLMRNADLALYRAKSARRGTVCFYEAAMDARMRHRQKLEHDLREAIGTAQIELHYQPLVNCGDTSDVAGFEALMRWTHPTLGPVSPVDFIPLAEETGLIVPLGLWALETACTAALRWPPSCCVAVNLSPAQFRNGGLPGQVAEILARTGLAPHRLELEVTEGLLITDAAQARIDLEELKSLGVRIALDDFGTGYSSLSYLRQFPFDKLKIDRSFVQALGEDASADAIVRAILAMGRSLHLDVTAEGVETAGQLHMLRSQGCDTVQGYLVSRPIASPHVAGFITAQAATDASPATPDTRTLESTP